MILRGARIAVNGSTAERSELHIHAGRICAAGAPHDRRGIEFAGYLIVPGLINAHDHLEFNLFPRLGCGPYDSATDWAEDIHKSFVSAIQGALKVPLRSRLLWGGIRNLICGVTTVCHHNPWHKLFDRQFPVRVVRSLAWAHSLAFSDDLLRRFRSCPPSQPFVFHAGEAVNGTGRREMTTLAELGLFAPNSVMVHAVALNRESLALARRNKCSVVWCPSSNVFILGKTLAPEVLASDLQIALGTDSALTTEGDMLDELRFARRVSGLDQERLYRMVTDGAAAVLRLPNGEGFLREGGVADLVLFRDHGFTPAETLFRQRPEAVFIGGRPQLVSEDFAREWKARFPQLAGFKKLNIAGHSSVLVRSKLPRMPAGFRLAGREVVS